MALIECVECSKQISDLALSCPGCGVPVAKKIECKECGMKVSELANSCPDCGAPIDKKNDSIVGELSDIAKNVTGKAKVKITHGLSDNIDAKINRFKIIVGGIYLLQILTIFFYIIPLIIGFVLTLVMKADAEDTWLESHFNYHIKTFKWTLFIVLGLSLILMLIGLTESSVMKPLGGAGPFILMTPYMSLPWLLYRAVKGGLTLAKNEPIQKAITDDTYTALVSGKNIYLVDPEADRKQEINTCLFNADGRFIMSGEPDGKWYFDGNKLYLDGGSDYHQVQNVTADYILFKDIDKNGGTTRAYFNETKARTYIATL